MNTQQKYALIGAGPAGLSGARNLQRFDIPFDGFEMHSDVGGLWDIENQHSTVYKSAHLISSKRMTEFDEFPMDDTVADYPHHSEIKKYFQDFAKAFKLYDYYQFNTKVLKIVPKDGLWEVTTEKTDGSQRQTNLYKGVLIANGTLSHPNIPEIPGEFSGELLHSSEYKDASIFEGKRVLIVGAGNSGCDIAVDAVHRAKSVAMSVRRGYHFVPKYVMGKPADTVGGKIKLPRALKQMIDGRLLKIFTGDPVRLGFPEPDHKIYESHPIVNSLILYHLGHGDVKIKKNVAKYSGNTVHFEDGSQEEYDMVLLATGYKLNYPFIDSEHLNWQGATPQMYLNAFHPKYDNLFILGMVEAAGLGWQGRHRQAELVARYIKACEINPKKAEKFRKIKNNSGRDMRGGFKYMEVERMAYYVHKDTYLKALNKHIAQLS